MKTSELKKIVKENGLNLKVYDHVYMIYKKGLYLCSAGRNDNYVYLDYPCPKNIAQAILDYAYTSLEEREEDKNQKEVEILQELVNKVESKTTAKEMFEKLGFSIDEQDEEVIAYSDENYRVIFYFIDKTYSFYRKEDDVSSWVHVVIHQAITQQLKELGWLE